MRKHILLLIGWLFVILLVSVTTISNPNSFFVNGTIICGWLLFIIQLTWNHSETFYMHIKSLWFYIKNPDCIWNMMVEYELKLNQHTFENVEAVFHELFSEVKITVISNIRRLYKLETINVEVSIDIKLNKIRLHIDNLEVSYRRSRNIIDKELGKLLEKLAYKLKIDNSDYYFNISFKEFNPYYGFFIRRLNAKDINSFNVIFNVEDEKVTINKESIEIHTTSLQKLNTISKEYLSLSPR